jgi:hypothetical protein
MGRRSAGWWTAISARTADDDIAVNGDARYRFGRLQRRHERSAAGQPPHPQGRVAAAADDDRVPSGSLPTATALTPWCGRTAAPRPGALGQPPHPHRAVAAEGCRLLPDLTVEDNLCLERLLPDARHCVGPRSAARFAANGRSPQSGGTVSTGTGPVGGFTG